MHKLSTVKNPCIKLTLCDSVKFKLIIVQYIMSLSKKCSQRKTAQFLSAFLAELGVSMRVT